MLRLAAALNYGLEFAGKVKGKLPEDVPNEKLVLLFAQEKKELKKVALENFHTWRKLQQ